MENTKEIASSVLECCRFPKLDRVIKLTNPRILIVCLRRIGDVLLATPLASSLRSAYPSAQIDWLVFESTAGVLQNNPVVDQVLMISEKRNFFETSKILCRIFMRYDIAFSTQAGDRPALFTRFAGRSAYALKSSAFGGRLRDLLMTAVVKAPSDLHRVDQVLTLLTVFDIQPIRAISLPSPELSYMADNAVPYVVFHPGAAFSYKQLNATAWRELYLYFAKNRYKVVITGGHSKHEKIYLDSLFSDLNVTRTDGKLSWPELVGLIQNAELFVGVDTSVTHLAAATGIKTYAIFGPTDPQIWAPVGPGPQRNVSIIQSNLPCVPCQLEGCERHILSRSECLDTLTAEKILENINLNVK